MIKKKGLSESMKKMVISTADFFLYIIFTLFLGKILRKKILNSTLVKWRESGKRISCPSCSSNDSRFFYRAKINILFGCDEKTSEYGILEKNQDGLNLYYGTWIPSFIWNRIGFLYLKYCYKELKKIDFDIDYFRCNNCDLIFQNYPYESDLLNTYYHKYYRRHAGRSFGRGTSQSHLNWKRLIAKYHLSISKLPRGSKILDIGCAEGCFCQALIDEGMDAYGIEPSEQMITYAREKLNLKKCTCGSYNITSYKPGYFDAIHCFHVLEHILDTDKVLQAMKAHLKNGGILSLAVPDVEYIKDQKDYNCRLGGGHIYNFTEKWLKLNLPKYGFNIFQILRTPHDLTEFGNHPGNEFGVSPWGDIIDAIYIFARKGTVSI